jgi:hypothetical protein
VAGQAGHDAQIGATFDEPAHQRQPGVVALRRGMEDQRLATDAGLVQCHCGVNIGAASQQQRRRVQLLEFGRHVQQRAAAQGQHACARGAEVQIRKAAVKQHCVGIRRCPDHC